MATSTTKRSRSPRRTRAIRVNELIAKMTFDEIDAWLSNLRGSSPQLAAFLRAMLEPRVTVSMHKANPDDEL